MDTTSGKGSRGEDGKKRQEEQKAKPKGSWTERGIPRRPDSAPPTANVQHATPKATTFYPYSTAHHRGGETHHPRSPYNRDSAAGNKTARPPVYMMPVSNPYARTYAVRPNYFVPPQNQFAAAGGMKGPPSAVGGTKGSTEATKRFPSMRRKKVVLTITTPGGDKIEAIDELRKKKEDEKKKAATRAADARAAKEKSKDLEGEVRPSKSQSDDKKPSSTKSPSTTGDKNDAPVIHPLVTRSVNKSVAAKELLEICMKQSESKAKDSSDPSEVKDKESHESDKESHENEKAAKTNSTVSVVDEVERAAAAKRRAEMLKAEELEAERRQKMEEALKRQRQAIAAAKRNSSRPDKPKRAAETEKKISTRTTTKIVHSLSALRSHRTRSTCAAFPAGVQEIASVKPTDSSSSAPFGRAMNGRNKYVSGGGGPRFNPNGKPGAYRSGGGEGGSWRPKPQQHLQGGRRPHHHHLHNNNNNNNRGVDNKPKRSTNAWSRSKIRAADPNLKKLRSCRDQLNKLTPEKFERISKNILELDIDNRVVFKGIIYAIFDMALLQPVYSEMYAKLCAQVSEKSDVIFSKRITKVVKLESGKWKFDVGDPECVSKEYASQHDALVEGQKAASFRRILLTKCQEEFEAEIDSESITKDVKWDEMSEAEKRQKRVEVNAKIAFAKKRMLGNIKFIGELFLKRMLSAKIMCVCISKCLKKRQEDYIESVCKLFSVVGKKLDAGQSKKHVESYFKQLTRVRKQKGTSTRIKFMIDATIELRSRSWIPRRDEKAPMRIAEVRQAAAHEELMKARSIRTTAARVENNSNQQTRSGGRQGNFMPVAYSRKSSSSSSAASVDMSKFSASALTGLKLSSSSAPTKTSTMSADDFAKKCNATLKEFLHLKDENEVKECLVEYAQSDNSPFVSAALSKIIDSKAADRALRVDVANLLAALQLKYDVVTKKDIINGVRSALLEFEDVCIDLPLAPRFVGEFFADLVASGSATLGALMGQIHASSVESGKAERIMSETLIAAMGCKGKDVKEIASLVKDDEKALGAVLKDRSVRQYLSEAAHNGLKELAGLV